MEPLDTIIMVHGAGGGGWEYRTWARIFRNEHWNVIAPDLLPARGGLAKTTVEDYVRQVVAWCPKNRSGRLVLVGASMGGPLVLAAAKELKPDAIVLVNPAPEIGSPNRKPAPAVVGWANGPYKDTVDAMPDSDEATRKYAWKRWRDESGTVLNGLRKGLNPPKPNCPVFLIVSGRDTDILPATSRKTAQRLGAKVMELPKHSHVGPLMAKDADTVALKVNEWIRALPVFGGKG